MRLRAHFVVVAAGLVALAGCAPTPASTPAATVSYTPPATPTPIAGLPNDHTLSTVNAHTAAGSWAFIQTTTGNPVGVRINGLWQGAMGSLGDRSYSQPAGQPSLDVAAAVPYFLSWSYVVLGGATDAMPAEIVLPSSGNGLFNVDSPFADHDCPDYKIQSGTGIGFLVTHCAVSMSTDGSHPIGLAFAVPNQTKQYWFLDAPSPTAKP